MNIGTLEDMDTNGSRYIEANLTEFPNECHPYCDDGG